MTPLYAFIGIALLLMISMVIATLEHIKAQVNEMRSQELYRELSILKGKYADEKLTHDLLKQRLAANPSNGE